jgi:hypothetical protein
MSSKWMINSLLITNDAFDWDLIRKWFDPPTKTASTNFTSRLTIATQTALVASHSFIFYKVLKLDSADMQAYDVDIFLWPACSHLCVSDSQLLNKICLFTHGSWYWQYYSVLSGCQTLGRDSF